MLTKAYPEIEWSWDKALRLSERISCSECGACCKKVTLDITDIKKISRYLNIKPVEVESAMGYIDSGEPCPLLNKDKSCSIYKVRPIRCEVYPIKPYQLIGHQVIQVNQCKAGAKLSRELAN